VISWGSPLLPARGTVARRNGFIQRRGGRVFGQPSGPQDRTPPTKLEIPFGHAFDRREVSLPISAVRACVPCGRRSAIEECTVLGVSGGVGGHEGALRDRSFSHRGPNASKMPSANRDPYPRPDSSCGTSVWRRTARPSSTFFSTRLRAHRRRGTFRSDSWPDCSGYGRGKRGEP
jgi:hypothetical protein